MSLYWTGRGPDDRPPRAGADWTVGVWVWAAILAYLAYGAAATWGILR